MSGAPPLQLDSFAHGEATGLRRGEDVIDSLAYIDDLTPEEQRAAEKLIKDEIKLMQKRPADYLKEMPKLHQLRFQGHPVLQAEYERVRAGQPMAALDSTRTQCLTPPENRRNDVAAWRASLDGAHSQLEHQYNRLLNLELLLMYAPKAWQAHLKHLEVALKGLEEEAAKTTKETGEVNRARKVAHMQAGTELARLEHDWQSVLQKNQQIDLACRQLEEEIAALQEQNPLPETAKDGESSQTDGVIGMQDVRGNQ